MVAPFALPFSYDESFRVIQALCGAMTVLAVALLLRRSPFRRVVVALALVALLPVLLGPVVVARYDLWPVIAQLARRLGRPAPSVPALGA